MRLTNDFNLDVLLGFDLVLGPYLETIDENINEFESTSESEYRERIRQLGIDREDTEMENHILKLQIILFRRVMRYSFVTFLYSSLDDFVMRLCEDHAKKHCQTDFVSNQEWRRKPVMKRFKEYLDKAVSWPRSLPEELVVPMADLADIRNCIVHCSGFIDRLRSVAKRKKLIGLDWPGYEIVHGQIVLDKEFCKESMSRVRSFLNQVRPILLTQKGLSD